MVIEVNYWFILPVTVEFTSEAELDSSHVGVPAGVKSTINPAAHLGMRLKGAREKLESSRWQNCYEEIPLQLNGTKLSSFNPQKFLL